MALKLGCLAPINRRNARNLVAQAFQPGPNIPFWGYFISFYIPVVVLYFEKFMNKAG
jgi:hypothetical protein